MTNTGVGDRWLAGERIPDVAFALNDPVRLTAGARAGQAGVIALLVALAPEPLYLVTLAEGKHVRVRQSALCAAG